MRGAGSLRDGGERGREDALLCFCHGACFRRVVIIPAGEMQQAVDDVERQFVVECLPVLHGLTRGGFRADQDFAVVEGDDVRRCRVLKEFAVDAGDLVVRDEANFDLFERPQDILWAQCGISCSQP